MESRNGNQVHRSVCIMACILLSGFAGRPGAILAAEDTWRSIADISGAREFSGGGVVEGRVYIIGGAPSDSSVSPVVEMYDPIVNTWTRMADMPSDRCGSATCTLDGKIYVFGGVSPNLYSTAKRNVYEYDPEADTWTQKSDMPFANAFCGLAVIDDTIYLIGGMPSVSNAPFSTLMAYSPVTETWTQKADMPTARGALSACVVDRKIYAIGGSTENWRVFSYRNVEVYDPSTDTWARRSDMPTQRWGLGTCVVDGKIYAVGGWSGSDACTANEVYDPTTDTWTIRSPMQQKRNGAYICSIENKIYAIGGAYALPQPGRLNTAEEYDTGLGVPSPDLDSNGMVGLDDLLRLIESWGKDDPNCDLAPPPFGDGTVDAVDLEVLMSYWGQEIPDPSLIAHWKLDEAEGVVAHDSIGGHDGTLGGNPTWQPEGGVVDGSLQLDGIDDCIDTPFVLDPLAGPFSVFAWVLGGAPGQVILSQEDGMDWLLAEPGTGCLMAELKSDGRSARVLSSLTVITDGDWHRVGLVWDGARRSLYVDDVLVAEDTQSRLAGCPGGLNIGAGNSLAAGSLFAGLIDDVRIYSRAVRP